MIERIVSGGQTGVDRAALDFAIEAEISHGGWVPKGRLAEDGRVPDRYQMKEHRAPTYPPRTEANVEDSDATVIFVTGSIQGDRGCLLTASICMKKKKPYLVVDLKGELEASRAFLIKLVTENEVKVLNVAGPRGSHRPDTQRVKDVLAVLTDR